MPLLDPEPRPPTMKLIITDIDGTLIDHEQHMPADNRAALHEAIRRGVRLVVATVRKRDATQRVVDELDLPCIKICQAGAAIYDLDDTPLRTIPIPLEVARAIAVICDQEQIPLLTTVDEQNFLGPNTPPPYVIVKPIPRLASNLEALSAAPTRLLIRGEANAERLMREFSDAPLRFVRHYRPNGEFDDLTITHIEATKENAMALVCQHLGISAQACLALGDSESDIGMITAAGVGVAMGDAHASVRAAADWVAPAAAEAGLAAAVRRFATQWSTG